MCLKTKDNRKQAAESCTSKGFGATCSVAIKLFPNIVNISVELSVDTVHISEQGGPLNLIQHIELGQHTWC